MLWLLCMGYFITATEIVGLQVTKRPYFMQTLKLIRAFNFFMYSILLSMCLKTTFSLNWSKIISNAIL